QSGGLRGITDLIIDLLACQVLHFCPPVSLTLISSGYAGLNNFIDMGTTLLGGSVWLSRCLVAAWWTLNNSGQLTPQIQNTLAEVAMYCCRRVCMKLIENSNMALSVSMTWTVLTLAGIVMHLSSSDQIHQMKRKIRKSIKAISTQVI
ncbi:unnamed protein product, partial [Meganyctiphanes norvegica]